jgi:hypothetical protein
LAQIDESEASPLELSIETCANLAELSIDGLHLLFFEVVTDLAQPFDGVAAYGHIVEVIIRKIVLTVTTRYRLYLITLLPFLLIWTLFWKLLLIVETTV